MKHKHVDDSEIHTLRVGIEYLFTLFANLSVAFVLFRCCAPELRRDGIRLFSGARGSESQYLRDDDSVNFVYQAHL